MPMGFYTKESIHPFYTTEKYLESEQHDLEVESLYRFENRLRSWFRYPWFLVIKGLTAIGYLAKPDDKQDK